jgi:hypothetical protein
MSTIQIKRGTGSAVPSGLADGELAINLDSGHLYFGSGSNSEDNFYFNNITASGDISASGNITVGGAIRLNNTAGSDYIDYNNGFFYKGNGNFQGNITSSGNISADNIHLPEDGKISFDNESTTDQYITGRDDYLTVDGDNILHLRADTYVNLDCNSTVATDITASGKISASGDITTSNNMSCVSMTADRFVGGTRSLSITAQTATASLAQGDIFYSENSINTEAGKIYKMQTNGNITVADKDEEMSAESLLTVAVGSDSQSDGMLLRGMVKLYEDPFPSGAHLGEVVYMGDSGMATSSIAGYAADDYIRIVGHYMSGSGVIYFNPDNTFIKKA